jgi:hypothetical protein
MNKIQKLKKIKIEFKETADDKIQYISFANILNQADFDPEVLRLYTKEEPYVIGRKQDCAFSITLETNVQVKFEVKTENMIGKSLIVNIGDVVSKELHQLFIQQITKAQERLKKIIEDVIKYNEQDVILIEI